MTSRDGYESNSTPRRSIGVDIEEYRGARSRACAGARVQRGWVALDEMCRRAAPDGISSECLSACARASGYATDASATATRNHRGRRRT
jgi:hypothetical protein